MTSLKVFHAATLPARLRALAWEELLRDLKNKGSIISYDGSEQLTDYTWLEGTLKQSMKALAITMFKGKKWSGLPLDLHGDRGGIQLSAFPEDHGICREILSVSVFTRKE